MKFDISVFFGNLSKKIEVSLKFDKNNGYFTSRPIYVQENISLKFDIIWTVHRDIFA